LRQEERSPADWRVAATDARPDRDLPVPEPSKVWVDPPVWAVVVTWNRRALLEQCLACLMMQTRRCDGVIVVDNASDDGTAEMLADAWSDKVTVVRMSANTGGAGGFHAGMRMAIARGAQRIWLMDDDVLAAPEALAALLDAEAVLAADGIASAFLCSMARSPQGQLTNTPEIDRRENALGYPVWGERLEHGVIPVRQATFVSVLVGQAAVLRHGLPLAPMFIWGDDTEYTLRLSRDGPGHLVAASRVVHVRAAPGRLTIETEADPGRERLHRYLTRNVIVAKRRHEGRCAAFRYAASRTLLAARLACQGRWRKAAILSGGVVEGMWFNPKVEYCTTP
jgi:dTDP-4-dehydrorhamnose reductase